MEEIYRMCYDKLERYVDYVVWPGQWRLCDFGALFSVLCSMCFR